MEWILLANGAGEIGVGNEAVVDGSLELAARGGELVFGVEHVERGVVSALVALLLDAEILFGLFDGIASYRESLRRGGCVDMRAAGL